MPLIIESEFTLYLLCGFFIVVGHAWIPHVSRAYERYFDKSEYAGHWLLAPPSVRHLSLWIFLSNIALAVSSINYLYWNKNPSVANQDYYLSIEALGMAVLGLKIAWHYCLMTFYGGQTGLIVAYGLSVMNILIIIGVIILLGVRAQWLSFGFMWPVAVFHGMAVMWTHAIWDKHRHWSHAKSGAV